MAIRAKDFPVFWMPDADPNWQVNPGVLVELSNLVPGPRKNLLNYCCAASDNLKITTPFVSADVPNTAVILRMTSSAIAGFARMLIGTNNGIIEYSSGPATVVDAVSGAAEWTFDVYGNTVIACCGNPNLNNQPTRFPLVSTGGYTTAFANLTGTPNPPKATICVVQGNMLLLFNVDDGVNWNPDGWNCSGLGNLASWTATTNFAGGSPSNAATQANNGRIVSTPGMIRAAVRQRDKVIVYKEDSMYNMGYTGNPFTWSPLLISDKVGQFSANGTAVVNGVHYFLHRTGVYRFDGSYPQNIGTGRVNRFLADWMSDFFEWRTPGIKAIVVENQNLIIWYMAKNDWRATTNYGINCALAYNYATDQFGWIDRPWEESDPTQNNMGCPVQATRNDAMWQFGGTQPNFSMPLIVGSQAGSIYIRQARIGEHSQGNTTKCGFVTGDIGDDYENTTITEMKPRLVNGDDDLQTATASIDWKRSQGDYYTGEGMMMQAQTTGLGNAVALMRSYSSSSGTDRRVIQAGDYMAFDYCVTDGNLTAVIGVQVLYSDASTETFAVAPSALQTVGSYLQPFTSGVGKTMNRISFYSGDVSAGPFWRGVVRKVRITDSTGLLREQVYQGNERRIFAGATVTGAYTGCFTDNSPAIGINMPYDPATRVFGEVQSSRWQRISATLWNRTGLAALALVMTGGGNR